MSDADTVEDDPMNDIKKSIANALSAPDSDGKPAQFDQEKLLARIDELTAETDRLRELLRRLAGNYRSVCFDPMMDEVVREALAAVKESNDAT